MKQPKNELKILLEDGDYWVDIDGDDGGMMNTAISKGRSEKAALLAAQRRLDRLSRECMTLLLKF